MSRTNVRAAVTDYFSSYEIAGVSKVLSAQPKIIDFRDPRLGSGPDRCFLIVFIEGEQEVRRSLGGPTSGKKQITYQISLNVLFHSVRTRMEESMDAYDVIIDSIKDAIRADRTFANPDVVWQAGASLVSAQHSEPELDGNTTMIHGVVSFPLIEYVTA
jgi:hypothetical protein